MLSNPAAFPPTSKSLKAALLFNPWTFASRANESLPCLLFHRVEEDDERAVKADILWPLRLRLIVPSGHSEGRCVLLKSVFKA